MCMALEELRWRDAGVLHGVERAWRGEKPAESRMVVLYSCPASLVFPSQIDGTQEAGARACDDFTRGECAATSVPVPC
jgi:hypothetical protein